MGDHRSASADSRAHVGDQYSGTIGVDDVIGKAAVIVWPVSRFGLLDSPDIQGTEAAAAGAHYTASPVTASLVAPYAIGLAGAVPITAWRRRRRSRHR
jgi:signal peptidase I